MLNSAGVNEFVLIWITIGTLHRNELLIIFSGQKQNHELKYQNMNNIIVPVDNS